MCYYNNQKDNVSNDVIRCNVTNSQGTACYVMWADLKFCGCGKEVFLSVAKELIKNAKQYMPNAKFIINCVDTINEDHRDNEEIIID
jgi:hypothetical protein